jgi:hypothetical protein
MNLPFVLIFKFFIFSHYVAQFFLYAFDAWCVSFVQSLSSLCQIVFGDNFFFHIFDRGHNIGQKLSWRRVKWRIWEINGVISNFHYSSFVNENNKKSPFSLFSSFLTFSTSECVCTKSAFVAKFQIIYLNYH